VLIDDTISAKRFATISDTSTIDDSISKRVFIRLIDGTRAESLAIADIIDKIIIKSIFDQSTIDDSISIHVNYGLSDELTTEDLISSKAIQSISDNVIIITHRDCYNHILNTFNKNNIKFVIIRGFRYLPEKVISYVAKEMNVSEHKIYGVATFYNQFKFIKPGKHTISVCIGTACHVKGAPSLINKLTEVLKIEPGETTKDEQFSLEGVFCLDCCASAPLMVVDDDVYGNMTSAKVKRTVSKYQKKAK